MSNKVTILKPGDDRRVIHGAGDEYHYLATGKETDGQYFLFEGIIPPGGGPPPHIQTREEELFYVLDGEITFYVEGEEVVAPKGTFINMPKGVKHNFRNQSSETAKMLFLFSPAGIEGLFDEMVKDQDMANHPEGAIAALNELGENYGVTYFESW